MASKPKGPAVSFAVWLALLLFLLADLGLPSAVIVLFGPQMLTATKLAIAQLSVSLLSIGGAICAFAFAFLQYKRGEQWKRLEFVAKEIKDFESDPGVQNAMLMIDWGERKINIYLIPNPQSKDFVKINREIQWKALLPHVIKRQFPEYRDPECEGNARFSLKEARIRDTYDAFFTRMDRFATFIRSGLITSDEVEPFIAYWIEEITKNSNREEDSAWRCTLLTYINFYNYSGVKYLLNCFGKDIDPGHAIYDQVRAAMPEKVLGERLLESIQPK